MTPNETVSQSEPLAPDVVNLLEDLGLSSKDIQIYEYLLKSGGAVPSAIARDTGQPRGRIYEGMRNLATKGFVRERPTRPILFFPTPLGDVLEAAQARLSRHLTAVRLARDAVQGADSGEPPPAPPRLMRMRDVSVLSGRRACNAEIVRLLESAGTFFWISGGGRFAERLDRMGNFLDAAKNAANRGVDVRFILPRGTYIGRALADLDSGQAHRLLCPTASSEGDGTISCATEFASVEMVAQPDDDSPTRGDDVAIHVANSTFAARVKHRLAGHLAVPMAPEPPAVFPWLGPDHGSDIFSKAIQGATSEVQVLGPAEWGTYLRATWDRQASAYGAARGRGVVLRVVASLDAASEADLQRFQDAWAIRVLPELPMWLTIIDGKQLYQAFPHPSLGGPPQFRRSEETHEIRFFQGLFEGLWSRAVALPQPRSPG